MDFCYCCYLDIPEGQGNPGEHSVQTGGSTIVANVVVCSTCRRLDCDVPNPEGCRNPERVAEGESPDAPR